MGTSMPSVVGDAQNKIKRILKHIGIKIKDVANETNTPYSTANEILNVPGRLNIPWLAWYADRFGTTTDYLLSRDKPDKEIGKNFQAVRNHAGLDAHEQLSISEYALDAIEQGEMEATLGVLRKVVNVCRVPTWFILGAGQIKDVDFSTSLLKDIEFLLICKEIYEKPELGMLLSILSGLSDRDLGRLVKIIVCLVDYLQGMRSSRRRPLSISRV